MVDTDLCVSFLKHLMEMLAMPKMCSKPSSILCSMHLETTQISSLETSAKSLCRCRKKVQSE